MYGVCSVWFHKSTARRPEVLPRPRGRLVYFTLYKCARDAVHLFLNGDGVFLFSLGHGTNGGKSQVMLQARGCPAAPFIQTAATFSATP